MDGRTDTGAQHFIRSLLTATKSTCAFAACSHNSVTVKYKQAICLSDNDLLAVVRVTHTQTDCTVQSFCCYTTSSTPHEVQDQDHNSVAPRWGPGVRTHHPPTFPLPGSAYWWTQAQFSQNISVS